MTCTDVNVPASGSVLLCGIPCGLLLGNLETISWCPRLRGSCGIGASEQLNVNSVHLSTVLIFFAHGHMILGSANPTPPSQKQTELFTPSLTPITKDRHTLSRHARSCYPTSKGPRLRNSPLQVQAPSPIRTSRPFCPRARWTRSQPTPSGIGPLD